MITGTLARYVALRFLGATIAVLAVVFLIVVLTDYVEMARRTKEIPDVSPAQLALISLYRVPHIAERIIPFAVLVGTMVCYLNLSRRLELVVARSAGVSAWQFVAPALAVAFVLGIAATGLYNPVASALREEAKSLEVELFAGRQPVQQPLGSFWLRQRTADGQAVISAAVSRAQGTSLDGVSVFTFDRDGRFQERIEAKSAILAAGHWRLTEAHIHAAGSPPRRHDVYRLPTTLTPEQVRESFATPETLSFWQLPSYIAIADQAGLAAAGYRLQYQLLVARPFLLVAMVLVAAAVSLRFFRLGNVTTMILSGIAAGFLLYVISKLTEDVSKAGLMHPVAAAWLPVLVGGFGGTVALLYQEDG